MSAIAQRRVAGATALMILLYLLQVALFAAPVQAVESTGDCTENNNYSTFTFVFVNGTVIEGNNCDGSDWAYTGSGNQGGQNAFFPGTGGAFDYGDADAPGMKVHVSCSEIFEGGWATNGDNPIEGQDTNWQIASYSVVKDNGSTCAETFFDVSVTPCTEEGQTDSVYVTTSDGYTVRIHTSGDPVDVDTTGSVNLPAGSYSWSVFKTSDGPESALGNNPFTVNECTSTPVASVSVGAECREDVAYFLVNDLTNATLEVDLNGDGDFDDAGESNVTTASVITAAAGVEIDWEATATGDAEFDGGQTTASGTVTVPDCSTPVASVSVGAECREDVAYFLVNDLTNATLEVDLNGDGDFDDAGESNVTTASVITAAAGVEIDWEATATGDAEFDDEQTTKSGTVTVPTCTTTTTQVTTTTQATTTTTTQPTTTTSEPDEVAGTTITTVPEVSADTLPFTGFESGDTVKLGLLALLAGALMLFAVRGPKEEEGAAAEIGGWSSL